MNAIDLLLSRLDNPRPSGRDRWRCACPACGSTNRSTLSIGVGKDGRVLLHCFAHGCQPELIAFAVGLDVADLFPPRDGWSPPLKRRRLLSHQQYVELLEFESTLVYVAAHNLANGHSLTPDDLERLNVAAKKIADLGAEARA